MLDQLFRKFHCGCTQLMGPVALLPLALWRFQAGTM